MATPYASVTAWSDVFEHAASVTPSDSTDLTYVARALYIGVSGDVKLTTPGGDTVTFENVPVGVLACRAARVWSTGTTAASIIAGW